MQETHLDMPNVSHIGDTAMPDETITQKEVSTILKRYNNYSQILFWLWVPLSVVLARSLKLSDYLNTYHLSVIFILSFFGSVIFVHCVISLWILRNYFQRLPKEEREILIQTAHCHRNELFVPVQLITDINPKTEYLRASTEPQDDTLLRAASYTETTSQEQLLRPSQNDSNP